MEILYLMVPLGLVLVGLGLWAFFWAVGSGQFDDLDSPGWSVLEEDKSRSGGDTAAPDPGADAPAAREKPHA
jgi:cbb3-type cytochrome oxidase maturation protein